MITTLGILQVRSGKTSNEYLTFTPCSLRWIFEIDDSYLEGMGRIAQYLTIVLILSLRKMTYIQCVCNNPNNCKGTVHDDKAEIYLSDLL